MKVSVLLLLFCIVFCAFALDGKEIMMKGFNFYADQGIKKYTCEMTFDPPNPMITKIACSWESSGKLTYDLEFSPGTPDAQKEAIRKAYQETSLEPSKAMDNMLKDAKITDYKALANGYSVTITPNDTSGQAPALTYAFDKNFKLLGTRSVSKTLNAFTKYYYTKINGKEVIEKMESTSKVSFVNPADNKVTENEMKTRVTYSNYKVE